MHTVRFHEPQAPPPPPPRVLPELVGSVADAAQLGYPFLDGHVPAHMHPVEVLESLLSAITATIEHYIEHGGDAGCEESLSRARVPYPLDPSLWAGGPLPPSSASLRSAVAYLTHPDKIGRDVRHDRHALVEDVYSAQRAFNGSGGWGALVARDGGAFGAWHDVSRAVAALSEFVARGPAPPALPAPTLWAMPVLVLAQLDAAHITTLDFSQCAGLCTLDAAAGLPRLRTLVLCACTSLTRLPPFRAGSPLEHLDMRATDMSVAGVAPLAACRWLRRLFLDDCCEVLRSNLAELWGCTKLELVHDKGSCSLAAEATLSALGLMRSGHPCPVLGHRPWRRFG